MIKYLLKGVDIMLDTINISWSKTKKNVEQTITKYIYYCLSVDSISTSKINDTFLLEELDINKLDNTYIRLEKEEYKKRINFINYVRFSFNKLTTEERKIIYL